ncbi:MAG: hypothetical protein ACRETL_16840 [Gammaproteobacteria bacterium]
MEQPERAIAAAAIEHQLQVNRSISEEKMQAGIHLWLNACREDLAKLGLSLSDGLSLRRCAERALAEAQLATAENDVETRKYQTMVDCGELTTKEAENELIKIEKKHGKGDRASRLTAAADLLSAVVILQNALEASSEASSVSMTSEGPIVDHSRIIHASLAVAAARAAWQMTQPTTICSKEMPSIISGFSQRCDLAIKASEHGKAATLGAQHQAQDWQSRAAVDFTNRQNKHQSPNAWAKANSARYGVRERAMRKALARQAD